MSRPLPPFPRRRRAAKKVRMAEDAWNTRDPGRGLARLHARQPLAQPRGVPRGPRGDRAVPERKWARELDYRLIKELWTFRENRIAVRFAYEWHDDSGYWFRPTATRTGSSTSAASCAGASRASTTCRSPRASASSTGRSAAGPTITRGSRRWVCDLRQLTLRRHRAQSGTARLSSGNRSQSSCDRITSSPRRLLRRTRSIAAANPRDVEHRVRDASAEEDRGAERCQITGRAREARHHDERGEVRKILEQVPMRADLPARPRPGRGDDPAFPSTSATGQYIHIARPLPAARTPVSIALAASIARSIAHETSRRALLRRLTANDRDAERGDPEQYGDGARDVDQAAEPEMGPGRRTGTPH